MLAALESAKHFIFLEYFIIEEGHMFHQIEDILEKKVKEGVEVRLTTMMSAASAHCRRGIISSFRKRASSALPLIRSGRCSR